MTVVLFAVLALVGALALAYLNAHQFDDWLAEHARRTGSPFPLDATPPYPNDFTLVCESPAGTWLLTERGWVLSA